MAELKGVSGKPHIVAIMNRYIGMARRGEPLPPLRANDLDGFRVTKAQLWHVFMIAIEEAKAEVG